MADLLDAAESAFAQGDWGRAFDLYLGSLNDWLRAAWAGEGLSASLSDRNLFALERVADLAVPFGWTSSADDVLGALGLLHQERSDEFGADYFRLKRIHLAIETGDLRTAFELLESMRPSVGPLEEIRFEDAQLAHWEARLRWARLPSWQQEVLLSRWYLEAGRVLAGVGQYRDGLGALRRGLTHSTRSAADLATIGVLPLRLALAGALLESGRLSASAAEMESARELLDPSLHPGFEAQWLQIRGKLLLLTGKLGDAKRSFGQILDLCRARGFALAELVARVNLAQVLMCIGQHRAAFELMREARSTSLDRVEAPFALRAIFLSELASERKESLVRAVNFPQSVTEAWDCRVQAERDEPRSEDSIGSPEDLPQASSFLTFFEDRSAALCWHIGRADVTRARRLLDEMRQVFESSDSDLVLLRMRVLESVLAYAEERWQLAYELLVDVLPELREAGLKPELWQATRALARLAIRERGAESGGERFIKEGTALLQELASSLPASDREAFWLGKWDDFELDLASELDALEAFASESASERAPLRTSDRDRLRERTAAFLDLVESHPVRFVTSIGDDRARRDDGEARVERGETGTASMPPRRARLVFLVLPEATVLLWRTGDGRCDYVVSRISKAALRERVAGLHAALSRNEVSIDERIEQVSRSIVLSEALARLPESVEALDIVPDDILHAVPFSLLRCQGEPLVSRYRIALDTFGSSGRSCGGKSLDTSRCAVIGVGKGARLKATDGTEVEFGDIEGVYTEVDSVRHWLQSVHGDPVTLVDREPGAAELPTRARVLRELEAATFVHVACHGHAEPRSPANSGLVLHGDSAGVGILSLGDISRLDLRSLRHVTLSSCYGADGLVVPGSRILSLAQTLRYRGVGSVLACLWPVFDRFALGFLEQFYRHLERCPADEALQQTQIDVRSNGVGGDQRASAPAIWGGFRIHGR